MKPNRAAPQAAPPPDKPTTSTILTLLEKCTKLLTPMMKSMAMTAGFGFERSIFDSFLRKITPTKVSRCAGLFQSRAVYI